MTRFVLLAIRITQLTHKMSGAPPLPLTELYAN